MSAGEIKQLAQQYEFLVPVEMYLQAGVHIGMHTCTKHMEKFVFKVRPDGLYIINIRRTDERIRIAAKFLASFEPEKILAVTARPYAFQPVIKFSQYVRSKHIVGRFVPGTLTNPKAEYYVEPEVILISDPRVDNQALVEAVQMGIPVVSFASTDAKLNGIELVIPANNKGRKSLALLYWLLARQILRERGELGPQQDLPEPPEAFEVKVE